MAEHEHNPLWLPFDVLIGVTKTAVAVVAGVVGTIIGGAVQTAGEAARDVTGVQHPPAPPPPASGAA